MTNKITLELTLNELKTLDKHIEYNEETKSVFDKIKDAYPLLKMTLYREGEYAVISYNDTTYYRLMGEDSCFCWYMYSSPTLVMVDDAETKRLLEDLYYNHIEVKKEKMSEWQPAPEQVEQGLKESFREAVKQDVVSSIKSPTLYDVCMEWWEDAYNKDCINDLVNKIEAWLPEEQSAAGSQNAYVECTVEGFNDCIAGIKSKLR